jgi:hypothetical protein
MRRIGSIGAEDNGMIIVEQGWPNLCEHFNDQDDFISLCVVAR